jgi:uncharacterized protein (TIGR02271 family)
MRYSELSRYQGTRFPEGMSDVRGFEVRTRDDEKVGKVSDLITSSDGRIRYLDVDLGGILNPRHVVVPVGAAEVDARRDVVWISGMSKDDIKALPDYTGEVSALTDDYESRVRGAYAGRIVDSDLYDQSRFYANRGGKAAGEARLTLSEEQLAVGKRQEPAGEAAIRKTVETEHVRKTVPVEREEAVVERHPLSADANADVEIGEDEIRIPLTREEVIAEKRAVPVEEVVLKKRVVTEDEPVEADLRRERIDERSLENVADRNASAAEDVGDATRRGSRKLADKLDDMKDRVDANPASRPGPDPTDRPERR